MEETHNEKTNIEDNIELSIKADGLKGKHSTDLENIEKNSTDNNFDENNFKILRESTLIVQKIEKLISDEMKTLENDVNIESNENLRSEMIEENDDKREFKDNNRSIEKKFNNDINETNIVKKKKKNN